MIILYRLPLPPSGSGSNSRGWRTKSAAAKSYRAECAAAYRAQGIPAGAPWPLVHVIIEMRVCRKRLKEPQLIDGAMPVMEYTDWREAAGRYRPRDAGNVHDACKSAIDALQPEHWRQARGGLVLVPGAGVVVGDDLKHMSLGAPGIVEVSSHAAEGVYVTVTQ